MKLTLQQVVLAWLLIGATALRLVGAPPAPPLPSRDAMLAALAPAGFSDSAVQIPATVVEIGILRYAPYVSYAVGENRELNIYGDLDTPACIEIGLYGDRITSDEEKRRCIAYLRTVFPRIDFGELELTGGKFLKRGIVVEITPPTAPDAYGGWWISAYNLDLVHQVAGTSASVSHVTVARTDAEAMDEWSIGELTRPNRRGGVKIYVRAYRRSRGIFVRLHFRPH